jgi:putative endonuclease
MSLTTKAVGAYGERVAARYLVSQGMRILERNWTGQAGEVDLILADGEELVFCEVKTRRCDAFGDPAEAVDDLKIQRIRQLAIQWIADHPRGPRRVRFDVVSIWPQPAGAAKVEHLPATF